jgi:hypothetical protein
MHSSHFYHYICLSIHYQGVLVSNTGKDNFLFLLFSRTCSEAFLVAFFFLKKKKTFLDFKTSSLVIGKIL